MDPWLGPADASQSRTGEILVGNIVPQVIASAFVVARIISKACIRRKWGADDTMLCTAWSTSIVLTTLSCVLTDYGAGIHADELPGWALGTNLKLQYASLILYVITLSLTKITICLFYLDIFADPLNRRLALAALSFVLAYTLPLVALSVFQCNPIAANWDKAVSDAPGTYCVPMQPHFWACAVCNMLADAWLAAQVVPNILPLQIPRRQKTVLLVVVSLGWLVIVASVIRLVRIRAIPDGSDFTWASYDTTIWSAVEVDTGLVCVAAPSTKPLIKKFAPGFLRSLGSSSSSSKGVEDGEGGGGGVGGMETMRLGNLEEATRAVEVGEDDARRAQEDEEAAMAAKAVENGVAPVPGWPGYVGGLMRSLSGRTTMKKKRGSLASTSSAGMGEIMKEVDVRVETTERDLELGSSPRFSLAGFRNGAAAGWRSSWRPGFMTKM